MIKLVPFKAWHMLAVDDRDNKITESVHSARVKEINPSFTAMLDNKPIGCAGIIILWPGVGHAWAAFSKEILPYKIWMTKHVQHALRDIVRAHALHRVEAVVLADNHINAEWLEILGFTREKDIAQSYTQDKRDVCRYELISRTEIST